MTQDPDLNDVIVAEAEPESGRKGVRLQPDKERTQNIRMAVFRGMKAGDPTMVQEYCAHFVIGESGEYMPLDEAMNVLDQVTLGNLSDAAKKLGKKIDDIFVPLESELASEKP